MAALLQIIAGHDARDSTSLNAHVDNYSEGLTQSLRGLKVGVLSSQLESDGLDSSVRSR